MPEIEDIGTVDARALVKLESAEFKALTVAARVKPVAPDRWRIVDIVHARIKALIDAATYYTTPGIARRVRHKRRTRPAIDRRRRPEIRRQESLSPRRHDARLHRMATRARSPRQEDDVGKPRA